MSTSSKIQFPAQKKGIALFSVPAKPRGQICVCEYLERSPSFLQPLTKCPVNQENKDLTSLIQVSLPMPYHTSLCHTIRDAHHIDLSS